MVFAAQVIGDRQRQEDSFAVEAIALACAGEKTVNDLLVVADGMGGHAGGAIASRVAVDAFVSAVRSGAQWGQETLAFALEQANQRISSEVYADQSLRGMGTTLLGVVRCANRLEWISVGDSPLLLYRDSQLVRLNEDHSMLPILMQAARAQGQSSSVALSDPRRSRLRSALTGRPLRLVDASSCLLAPDDILILGSDGIETLTFDDIVNIFENAEDDNPERLVRTILRKLVERRSPRQDNATVVVYRHP